MKLDEQSFQRLLSAAYTIQEYNDRNLAVSAMAHGVEYPELLNCVPNLYTQVLKSGEAGEGGEEAADEELDPNQKEAEGIAQQTRQQLSQTQEQQYQTHIGQLVAEVRNSEINNHLLREIVQQALQGTHATGAVIALEQQGKLSCWDAAGDSASEIGAMINAGSGFTGVCASSRTMQFCSNTMLDPRVDADAYRKLGVRTIIVVPLLHQDQLLGLIAVFSRRPYAFGMRDLQVLQDLAEKFTGNLQVSAESAKANTNHEPSGTLNLSL